MQGLNGVQGLNDKTNSCTTRIAACSTSRSATTERLAEAGIEPSVGSRGDSFDNALAESTIGLYKTELVSNLGPWEGIDELELATLEWVELWNHRGLLGPFGRVPSAELRAAVGERTERRDGERVSDPRRAIVFCRSSVSTPFVLAALRALRVDIFLVAGTMTAIGEYRESWHHSEEPTTDWFSAEDSKNRVSIKPGAVQC